MTNQLPKLALDGVLCDRPQPGCIIGGKRNYARDNISNRKEKTMTRTLSADQLSRYVEMRIQNPAAADRYWATCKGRNIAADASIDDETTGRLKEFLKSRLSGADHEAVCSMLDGEPDAEAQDDLPENAVERPPEAKKGVAGLTTDSASFNSRYPGLSHVRLDNSGLPIPKRASHSAADTEDFYRRYPDARRIKQA
jgi:hypothetical protein